jgi:hypothetical protein
MGGPKDSKKKIKGNLDDLKRELELDEHRIPVEDLYRRMKCDPVKVSYHTPFVSSLCVFLTNRLIAFS